MHLHGSIERKTRILLAPNAAGTLAVTRLWAGTPSMVAYRECRRLPAP
jgi:hypothetical protein